MVSNPKTFIFGGCKVNGRHSNVLAIKDLIGILQTLIRNKE